VHSLADEIQSYVIDVARIHHLLDRVLAALDRPHPSLSPTHVMIDDDDEVTLVGLDASPSAPYAAPEGGQPTIASTIYAVGIILRELLADRPDIAPAALELIAACTNGAPTARPSPDAVRAALARSGWDEAPRAPWRKAFVPTDPQEIELVNGVRTRDTRLVYADWLEQHGFDERAKFLRLEDSDQADDVIEHHVRYVAPTADVTWRAIVSRARIAGCTTRATCPNKWDALEPLAFDNIRRCGACAKPVYYCASTDQARVHGRREQPIAVDGALQRALVLAAYDAARMTFQGIRYTMNPPAPRRVRDDDDEQPGVLTRLFGLFRRR